MRKSSTKNPFDRPLKLRGLYRLLADTFPWAGRSSEAWEAIVLQSAEPWDCAEWLTLAGAVFCEYTRGLPADHPKRVAVFWLLRVLADVQGDMPPAWWGRFSPLSETEAMTIFAALCGEKVDERRRRSAEKYRPFFSGQHK